MAHPSTETPHQHQRAREAKQRLGAPSHRTGAGMERPHGAGGPLRRDLLWAGAPQGGRGRTSHAGPGWGCGHQGWSRFKQRRAERADARVGAAPTGEARRYCCCESAGRCPRTQHLSVPQPDQSGLRDALGHAGEDRAAARWLERGPWPLDKLEGWGGGAGGKGGKAGYGKPSSTAPAPLRGAPEARAQPVGGAECWSDTSEIVRFPLPTTGRPSTPMEQGFAGQRQGQGEAGEGRGWGRAGNCAPRRLRPVAIHSSSTAVWCTVSVRFWSPDSISGSCGNRGVGGLSERGEGLECASGGGRGLATQELRSARPDFQN